MNKKKYFLGIVCLILIVASILSNLLEMFTGTMLHTNIAYIIVNILIIIYGLVAYKVPHGNLLKYLIIVYCLGLFYNMNVAIQINAFLVMFTNLTVICIMAFMSGRLHKIKENAVLLIICFILLLLTTTSVVTKAFLIDGVVEFRRTMVASNSLTTFICVAVAYVVRYDEHLNAGKKVPKC